MCKRTEEYDDVGRNSCPLEAATGTLLFFPSLLLIGEWGEIQNVILLIRLIMRNESHQQRNLISHLCHSEQKTKEVETGGHGHQNAICLQGSGCHLHGSKHNQLEESGFLQQSINPQETSNSNPLLMCFQP